MSNPVLRLALILLIPLSFLIACSDKDDVSAIRQLVEECASLAEEHNAKGIIEQTTQDFYAHPGQRDRMQVRKILWWVFRQYGAFEILYPEPSIELVEAGRVAKGTIYFMIVRKEQLYPALKELYEDPDAWLEQVGKNADLYRLNLDFSKKDGEWLVKMARLENFKGLGFGE